MQTLITIRNLGAILLVAFSSVSAFAFELTEVEHLTNPAIEALAPSIQTLAKDPALGACAPQMRRVKATDLQDQILENAMNEFVAGLENGKNMKYDFGILVTTESNESAVTASLLHLVDDNAADASKQPLSAIAKSLLPILAADAKVELKSGSAFYQVPHTQGSAGEEELTLRVISDKVNNEFLLFGAGTCAH